MQDGRPVEKPTFLRLLIYAEAQGITAVRLPDKRVVISRLPRQLMDLLAALGECWVFYYRSQTYEEAAEEVFGA